MQVDIQIRGESDVFKDLEHVETGAKAARVKALKRIAKRTVEVAERNLLQHGTVDTGALLNSIKISEKGLTKNNPTISVYADYPDLTVVNAKRKTPLPKGTYYAFAVEYGTKDINPEPYLQPAKAELEDTLSEKYVDCLKEELHQ